MFFVSVSQGHLMYLSDQNLIFFNCELRHSTVNWINQWTEVHKYIKWAKIFRIGNKIDNKVEKYWFRKLESTSASEFLLPKRWRLFRRIILQKPLQPVWNGPVQSLELQVFLKTMRTRKPLITKTTAYIRDTSRPR